MKGGPVAGIWALAAIVLAAVAIGYFSLDDSASGVFLVVLATVAAGGAIRALIYRPQDVRDNSTPLPAARTPLVDRKTKRQLAKAAKKYRSAVVPASASSTPAAWTNDDDSDEFSDDDLDGDDHYFGFVDQMWARGGIDLGGIRIQVTTSDGRASEWQLMSLVPGKGAYPYLNVLERGERRTYAADDRHRYARDGEEIDSSAFIAVARGVKPEVVLRREPAPGSVAAALSPEYDRYATTKRRFVIGYENRKGELSYRVISSLGLPTDPRFFSARCHFRWGQRRTFNIDRLRSVLDVETGASIPLDQFPRSVPKRKVKSSRPAAKLDRP